MQLSLPFIDIIIFAVIAIFLVYRLKSILGQNSEGNEQNSKIDLEKKDFTNVVNLGNKKLDSSKKTISTIDPNFNEKEFLKGAQNFFQMVIDCFVKGDLKNIVNFIDDKLIKNFQAVIDDRLEAEQIKVLKDKKGKIIDGDQNNSIIVKDLWIFEKEIQSKDLNWKLVETSNA